MDSIIFLNVNIILISWIYGLKKVILLFHGMQRILKATYCYVMNPMINIVFEVSTTTKNLPLFQRRQRNITLDSSYQTKRFLKCLQELLRMIFNASKSIVRLHRMQNLSHNLIEELRLGTRVGS